MALGFQGHFTIGGLCVTLEECADDYPFGARANRYAYRVEKGSDRYPNALVKKGVWGRLGARV